MILVRLKEVGFDYKNSSNRISILKDINLTINEGDSIAIVGSNGSGKSTLAKIVSGLLKPSEGEIFYKNHLISKDNKILLNKNIGMIFQDPNTQFIGSSVEDDIALSLEIRGIKREHMIADVNNIIEDMNLVHLRKRNANDLSGGEKQKVAIASQKSTNKEMMIYDEPTSMIDNQQREMVLNFILNNSKKNEANVIITHDMDIAMKFKRIIALKEGKIVFDGKNSVFFNKKNLLKSLELTEPLTLKIARDLKLEDEKIFSIKNLEKFLRDYGNKSSKFE